MTSETPVVIVASSQEERGALRPFFPSATILVPGNTWTAPTPLRAVLVSPSVDIQQAWFGACIVGQLEEGGQIYEFMPRWHRPFYG